MIVAAVGAIGKTRTHRHQVSQSLGSPESVDDGKMFLLPDAGWRIGVPNTLLVVSASPVAIANEGFPR